jgi:hypothetical protein
MVDASHGKIMYDKGLNAFKNEDYEHVLYLLILKGLKILQ